MHHRLIHGITAGNRSHDDIMSIFFLPGVKRRILRVSSNHREHIGLKGHIEPVQRSPGITVNSDQHVPGMRVDQRQFDL